MLLLLRVRAAAALLLHRLLKRNGVHTAAVPLFVNAVRTKNLKSSLDQLIGDWGLDEGVVSLLFYS